MHRTVTHQLYAEILVVTAAVDSFLLDASVMRPFVVVAVAHVFLPLCHRA
jgi:hypothetical protein